MIDPEKKHMYCPRCGQEQISNETRFCSRCGFLMTGVFELLASGGAVAPTDAEVYKVDSPRKRGLKHGLFFLLLTFLVVPLISIITVWLRAEPIAVIISSVIFFVGGLLRMAYAMLFESRFPHEKTIEETVYRKAQNLLDKKKTQNALPPPQSIPADGYLPPPSVNWRDTNDLQPSSVTDTTTKLLSKDR